MIESFKLAAAAGRSMRLTVLALVLTAILAGCANNAGPAATPTAAPTSVTTPAAPAAFQDVHLAHDFSGADETKTFDIPANAPPVQLHVFFTATTTSTGVQTVCPPAQSKLEMKIVSPANQTISDRTYQSNGVQTSSGEACGGDQNEHGIVLAAGKWTVKFTGTSQGVTGKIDITKA